MNSHLQYRPDIDGMCALAVLAVVLYHAFPNRLPGGFIGVDVFFVISGYLITTILVKSQANHQFSIFEFYSRRIRRIFPALLLVLISCLVFGWFFLFDSEYQQLGKHTTAGAGFVANLAFWGEAGYFDDQAILKPLLHLWSLGVEEQFYLAWPLILWAGWAARKYLMLIVAALACASFIACVVQTSTDQVAAFYSPLTRFWELAAGGVLACRRLLRANQPRPAQWLNEASAICGLLMLVIGFFTMNESRAFPGALALIPVVATVLLIGPAEGSSISRTLLANRVAIWFGLISFPLYLWHWPLLSFASIVGDEIPRLPYRVGLVLASIVLAWATFKLVEAPLRHAKTHKVVAGLAAVMLVTGAVGFALYKGAVASTHAPHEMPGETTHAPFFTRMVKDYYPCTEKTILDQAMFYKHYVRCMQSKNNDHVDIAIIGDSHSEHLFPGLASALPERNIAYYIKNGPPVIDNPDFKTIFAFMRTPQAPRKVILSAHWIKRRGEVTGQANFEEQLYATAQLLLASGKEVVLMDDVPRFRKRCTRATDPRDCSISLAAAREELDTYKQELLDITRRDPRIRYIPIDQYVCGPERCSMIVDGKLIYRDRNHLNFDGSLRIGQLILRDNPELKN